MLINLDATQLLCMPMFCSDACRDLSKRVGRVNTSCYIRYMTLMTDLLLQKNCAFLWLLFYDKGHSLAYLFETYMEYT